jgi:6-phosphofructokinase 1
MELDPHIVRDIHQLGGTILGSSRGPQPIDAMVDCLVSQKVDILFTIGGDGTLKGAQAIHDEIGKRGLKISVIGLPKVCAVTNDAIPLSIVNPQNDRQSTMTLLT